MAEYLEDIDRETGEYISGWPRIKQSIKVILTTRLKTRLMRLWWGSDFLDLQDKPGNKPVLMVSIIAAAEAINLYEPEFRVQAITVDNLGPSGSPDIIVDGVDLVERKQRRLSTGL